MSGLQCFPGWYLCFLSWGTGRISRVLIDFSLAVKAATLISISRCGSAVSSA